MMRFYHTVFDEKVRGDTLSRRRAQEGGEFGRAGRKGMCAFSEILKVVQNRHDTQVKMTF